MTTYLEENHPPLHPDLTADYFASRLDEAQVIAEQNGRFNAALDDPIFESDEPSIQDDLHNIRQSALDSIGNEQAATIEELTNRDNSPYELIASEYKTTVTELATAEKHLADLETDPRETRLRLAAQRAIALAPLSEPAATKIAKTRIENIQAMNRHDVELVTARLGSKAAELGQLYDLAGTAWPVPQAIHNTDPDILVIDEIPLDPESHASPEEETIRKLIERHGSTHGASILLTAYLIDNPDVVFTPDQLGEMLYQDESHFDGMTTEEREVCIRKRIQRLLNQDARVVGYVEDEGMYLQYGYRRFMSRDTGLNVRNKRRIYRVTQARDGVEDEFEETVLVAHDGSETRGDNTMILAATPSTISASTRKELLKNDTLVTSREKLPDIDIVGLATALHAKRMLPGSVDATFNPMRVRTALLKMGKDLSVEGFDLKLLNRNLQNATTSTPYRARDIIANALDIEARYFKDRSLQARLYTWIDENLAEFYGSLADKAS